MENTKNTFLSPEQQRKELAEKLWLHYFNRTLFEQGIITESERNRMSVMIESRKPRHKK